MFAPLSARGPDGEPDFVTGRHPINSLQEELQVETKLELPNDNDCSLFVDAEKIAAADLPLHHVAEALQEPFDRGIKRSFEGCIGTRTRARHLISRMR